MGLGCRCCVSVPTPTPTHEAGTRREHPRLPCLLGCMRPFEFLFELSNVFLLRLHAQLQPPLFFELILQLSLHLHLNQEGLFDPFMVISRFSRFARRS